MQDIIDKVYSTAGTAWVVTLLGAIAIGIPASVRTVKNGIEKARLIEKIRAQQEVAQETND